MKHLFACILLVTSFFYASGQETVKEEQKIRALEIRWPLLLEKNDTIALKKILSEKYVVNTVNGQISTRRQILDLVKAGRMFPKVERTIERITFSGPVAIVMGSETEFSQDPQIQTTRRRFTNVWSKQGAEWKMIGRQASNVCLKD